MDNQRSDQVFQGGSCPQSRRRVLKFLSAVIAVAIPLIGSLPQSTTAAMETWCVSGLKAYDVGNGTLLDPNYVVEFETLLYPGDDAEIHYLGERQYLDYHGGQGPRGRLHRWGVSTGWAILHPAWRDDSRWEIRFRCREA